MELIEISHPLKDHYLTNLRDKNTDFDTFRDSASKLSYFLVVEATKHLTTLSKEKIHHLQRLKVYKSKIIRLRFLF